MKKLYFLIGMGLMLHLSHFTHAQVPTLTVGNGGSLTVATGATLLVKGNFVTDNGSTVTNNGNIVLQNDPGTGDSYLVDVTTSGTTFLGTGTVTLSGTGLQNIYGLGGAPLTMPNLIIVNTSNPGVWLNGRLQITNVLELDDAILHKLITAQLYVSNSATGAIINGGTNSWVDGSIRREVLPTGTYWFPVGDSSYYQPFFLTINSSSGITSVTVQAVSTLTNPAPNPAITFVNSTPISSYLDRTQWPMSFTGGGSMNCNVAASERAASAYPPSANYIALLNYDGINWHGTNFGGTGGNHVNGNQSITAGPVATANKANINLTGATTFEIGVSLGNALPISAALEGDNKGVVNELHLIATSEEQTKYLVFEKSVDGKEFILVDTLAAAGYSTVTKVYTTTDENPYPTTYYRVRIIDEDGTVTTTNIISLRLPEEVNNDVIVLYPNPSTGNVTVSIETEYLGQVSVIVTDMLGREVCKNTQSLGDELGSTVTLALEQKASGMYAVSVSYGNIHKVFKLMVQK